MDFFVWSVNVSKLGFVFRDSRERMAERSGNQQTDKKKKETILDLSKYLDKKIRVKFSGGREASGILKGERDLDHAKSSGQFEWS